MARNLLSLVAIGGSLVAAPATALELGDVSVQSSLGQPLRASIAYALAPNEILNSSCVTISAGQSTGGLPGIGQATVNITESAILISSPAAVREALIGTRVTINCPYAPNLSREYMLFVDPSPVAKAQSGSAPAATPQATPQATPAAQPIPATQPVNVPPANSLPIVQSTNYQVRPGDTLSGIVGRIESRAADLRPSVDAIFAANPDAFIGADPNRLRAGAWLSIPSLDGTPPVFSPAGEPVTAEPEVATTPVTGADSVYEPPSATLTDTTADLKPGDVVYAYDAAEPGATTVTPDSKTEQTPAAATSRAVPIAVVSTGARRESTSLLAWLIGGSLVVIGVLAFFGRRFRKQSGRTQNPSAATEPAAANQAAVANQPPAAEDNSADADANCDIDDDSPTEENLALDTHLELGADFELDADLGLGTGFDQTSGIAVEEVDFGFAAATDLDIELPFESAAEASADTDIIPPMNINVESILESEVLPEDDDYDMSVIVDATKMPRPEEVTERDLQAVEVGSGEDSMITDTYTVSSEVDYDILEQDYEDALTATQALNEEIERAAAEIAKDFGATDEDPAPVLPKESFPELDGIPELPVANDDETAEAKIDGGTHKAKRLG